MKNRIRIIGILAMTFLAAVVVAFFALQPDRYHTRERRAAKAQMIEEIGQQVARLSPDTELEGGKWWNEDFIRFYDGSWIAYRAQCHKVDPKVYDLFIGRGSDGTWYYSTHHFCIGMLALQDHDQMDNLQDFISEYSLESFDGSSDQALLSTWPQSTSGPGT